MGKQCEDCKTEIGEQYTFCVACANKRKANKSLQGDKIEKELSAINNNLYFIRRAIAIILRTQIGKQLIWDKTKKDFVEKEVD